ncbi:amino acid ABC transporter permease [Rhodoligotrophos defluvii]|uniref:amino acid ABC transporter permease n=1 Tax=Rhodoligotrophos defluvii TaxID=2561934 RepID=UPI0010C9EC88|nr:amino acid ABC transporter permease [Rhodoligotrophos defluvii]
MSYNWDWGVLFELAPDGTHTYMAVLLHGALWTAAVALSSYGIALVLGAIVGVLRTAENRILSIGAATYVELFRNIPLIVQMFLWYFVFPEFLPSKASTWVKQLSLAPFIMAVAALGLYTSARIAELLRSAIQSRPPGQINAALALGLTRGQAYRLVLLPVAFRLVVPPLTSEFIGVIKNSAIALTIGVVELTASSRLIQELTFHIFEVFTVASLIYLAMNFTVVKIMGTIEQACQIPGMIKRQGAANPTRKANVLRV